MKRKTRKLKRRWPPKCMELPGTVEAIERGITAAVQKDRDRYGPDLLLPIGGALVAVPGRQDGPQHDDVTPADLEHLDGKRSAGGGLGASAGREAGQGEAASNGETRPT